MAWMFPSLKGFDLCLDKKKKFKWFRWAIMFPSLKGFDLCLDGNAHRRQ